MVSTEPASIAHLPCPSAPGSAPMAWMERRHELRSAMRVRSKASICIHGGSRTIRGRVVDLAVGGVCVRADLPFGLICLIGRLVHVDLRPDTRASKQFVLTGRVLRVSPPTGNIAIKFDAVPEGFEDFVQDELLAAVQHDSLPRMILVDTRGPRRNTIANAFRAAGCDVTEASTPLEAIAHLGGSRFEPGLIAIADTVPESVAEELREFVLVEHPGAHMVAIGRSAAHRGRAESWLCSTNARGDLQTRVSRVITAHRSRRQRTTSPLAS
ncbi:MAG TPA: PilZ domain-containing protein [Kofleriaceae bacterium]|nr:PilZ domain-containing protein [Kofleriaceae bacterium]